MTTYVALLRSINVGGHKMVPMKELRSLSERLGFIQAHTLLQSGNLIFRSEVRSAKNLEKMLETETEKYFGFAVEYFVRSAEEWHDIIARNPFQAYARKDPAHLAAISDVADERAIDAIGGSAVVVEGGDAKALGGRLVT